MSSLRGMIFSILMTVGAMSRPAAQNQTERIALYCKVWGFLKYHHPAVAGGSIDWDSVFVAHIDRVIGAGSDVQLNAELSLLIRAAGPITDTQTATLPDRVFASNHDLRWLRSSPMLDRQNRENLLSVFRHRNRRNNRFVQFRNYTDYSGEKAYPDMVWPRAEYRLLFLARFWNAIDYYDPYKYIVGEDWNNVLTAFIPRIRQVKDTLSYHRLLLQLAVALHDGHAQLITKDDIWGKYWLPVYISVLDDTVVITHLADDSVCKAAGIKKGDIILRINGESISRRIARFKPFTTASDQASLNRHLEYTLLCTPDTMVELTVRRGQRVFSRKVATMPVSKRSWTFINKYTGKGMGYSTIGHSIAYVYAGQIWRGNIDTIQRLIRSKEAVIFDARNYSDNDDFYNLFGMFLPAPTPINYSTFILPDDPGFFQWTISPKLGAINPASYRGMVVILADERCQSQGEYAVMTLQTIPHAITIGSQTGGLDGVVSSIPMGGGLEITHSGYGIYYPDKTPTQRRGVRIDIHVRTTVSDVIEDRDPALEEAVRYLEGRGIKVDL